MDAEDKGCNQEALSREGMWGDDVITRSLAGRGEESRGLVFFLRSMLDWVGFR